MFQTTITGPHTSKVVVGHMVDYFRPPDVQNAVSCTYFDSSECEYGWGHLQNHYLCEATVLFFGKLLDSTALQSASKNVMYAIYSVGFGFKKEIILPRIGASERIKALDRHQENWVWTLAAFGSGLRV